MNLAITLTAAVMLWTSLAGGQANAAEIKLLFPGAMVREMNQLIPEFERLSGHKVTSAPGNIFALTDRIQKGEVADLVIVSNTQIDDLIKGNRVIARPEGGPACELSVDLPDSGSTVPLLGPLTCAQSR